MDETWIGLAMGVSTLVVALPMALIHYWREQRRARVLRTLRQHGVARTQGGASEAAGACPHDATLMGSGTRRRPLMAGDSRAIAPGGVIYRHDMNARLPTKPAGCGAPFNGEGR